MTKVDTQAYFDVEADDYYERNYERPRSRHSYNLWLRRTACLELLPNVRGPVLDLGCGPGAMTFPLLERGVSVVSMDLSGQMLARLAARARRVGLPAAPVMANALELPFRDRSFETVVTTGVLEYVPDLARALDEIHRVIRPGGVLVATMSLPRRLERATMAALNRARGRPTQASQRIYDRRGFDAAVRNAGFAIDAQRCCAFAPFPLDLVWPASVRFIDQRLGPYLDQIDFARDQAKTYIVRATS